MPGDEGHHGGEGAVGDRDAGVSRSRHGRADSGHYLKRYFSGRQLSRLFAAAAEDEGVPAFQAHHRPALAAEADQKAVYFLLLKGVNGASFSHINFFRLAGSQGKQVRVGQRVINDVVGDAQALRAFYGQQAGIAGSGSHKIYFAFHISLWNQD